MRTQVVIIGAGPAGLMLGKLLENSGIDTVILERKSADYVLTGGELRPGGNLREVADSLRAVGRDHEMGLASLAREPGEQGADDAFVVGMGEDGNDGTPGLRVRRERDGRGQGRDGEDVDGDAHGIQCSATP